MKVPRILGWVAVAVLAPIALAAILLAIFGFNWMRGPIERMTLERTGRVLSITGGLGVGFSWPRPVLRFGVATFANPDWAQERQMIAAEATEVTIDLLQLLHGSIVLPEVRLVQPVVYLEHGTDGRRNWLLDPLQQDEGARIRIDRLTLDRGTLGYDDALKKTRIRATLSSAGAIPGIAPLVTSTVAGSNAPEAGGVQFTAQGSFEGQTFKASGSGGPVLALRDEDTPYPLTIDLVVGPTGVKADGTITSLLKFTAADMRMTLHGASLADLFPIIGIAFPKTRAYTTTGHLVHAGQDWRYEQFTGRVGDSDLAGRLSVATAGQRPVLKAELTSKVLDLADLGPLIGSRPGSVQAARKVAVNETPSRAGAIAAVAAAPAPRETRVLPDMPFNTDHWDSVDADVTLKAGTIRRAKELPLENLSTHLSLRDSVLTLDPLSVGVAGGRLDAVISLDGRKTPIQAKVHVRARKVLLAKLFPTIELNKNSIGQINGDFDLTGSGSSVGRMLAGSNGHVGLVVANGELSKLMMEKLGLHLWEILELKVSGDRMVNLRCAVADFNVRGGTMRADALVLDTEVTTIFGTGTIDLDSERLDLTLNQKTKSTSPLALRSPIYIRGRFAAPVAEVDKGRMAVRALGAVALGIVSPFLLLVPLIDAGPGKDSDCAKLIRGASVHG